LQHQSSRPTASPTHGRIPFFHEPLLRQQPLVVPSTSCAQPRQLDPSIFQHGSVARKDHEKAVSATSKGCASHIISHGPSNAGTLGPRQEPACLRVLFFDSASCSNLSMFLHSRPPHHS
jgi:hypothetical protein